MLIGPSYSVALHGALEIANEIDQAGQSATIVTIFPDSGERYLSESHIWEEDSENSSEWSDTASQRVFYQL